MFGQVFAPLAMKIATGVALTLMIALGVTMWRADVISEDRERIRNLLATEVANHAVTRSSVVTLEQALGRYVGAGAAARIAQIDSLEAQADDNALLQRQADAIRAEMETLVSADGCATPDSILNAEGL